MDDQAEKRVPIRAGKLRGNQYSSEFGVGGVPTPPIEPKRSRGEFDLYIRSISIGTVTIVLLTILLFLLNIAAILLIAKGW